MLVSFVPVRKLVVFCHVVENTPVRVREGLECFMIDGKGIQTRRETVSVGNGPHWRYTHRGESQRLPAASKASAREYPRQSRLEQASETRPDVQRTSLWASDTRVRGG